MCGGGKKKSAPAPAAPQPKIVTPTTTMPTTASAKPTSVGPEGARAAIANDESNNQNRLNASGAEGTILGGASAGPSTTPTLGG